VVAFAEANYDQNSGNSNYHALQASLERRASDVTSCSPILTANRWDSDGCHLRP